MGTLKNSPNEGSVPPVRNTQTPIKHTVADSFTDPLYNKYVIIGVLVFFVTILLLIILAHVIRYLHHRTSFLSLSHMAQNGDTRALEDSLEGDEDDDDLVDLYTSCRLYVEDSEINTASASDLDCVSVTEGQQDSFVNEYKEMKPSESLDKSRDLLTRHFQKR